jgi:hypothetical protein
VLSVPRGEAEDPKYSSVTAEIDVTTLITGEPQRDEHLRSAGRTPDRLIFPFVLTASGDLVEALPRNQTAHAALRIDILDVLRGESLAAQDRPSLPTERELTPTELRVLRFLPTNMFPNGDCPRALPLGEHRQYARAKYLRAARVRVRPPSNDRRHRAAPSFRLRQSTTATHQILVMMRLT